MHKKMLFIWEKIKEENIVVKHDHIKHTKEGLIGVYIYRSDAGPLIVLDKSLLSNTRQYNCTLTHEVAHHFTGARTNFLYASVGYTTEIERSRDERRAMKWAANALMPNAEVYAAIKRHGIKNPQELAEFFEVTASFCMAKLTFLKQELREYGIRIKGRQVFNLDLWTSSMLEQ